jgi:hypothetical protein
VSDRGVECSGSRGRRLTTGDSWLRGEIAAALLRVLTAPGVPAGLGQVLEKALEVRLSPEDAQCPQDHDQEYRAEERDYEAPE